MNIITRASRQWEKLCVVSAFVLSREEKIEIEMFVAAIFTSQFDFYLTTRNRLANEDDKSFVG